jgi:hypothetical protein
MRPLRIAQAYRRGLPAKYGATIRRGGTIVGDGALGTRWSGLVECNKTSVL